MSKLSLTGISKSYSSVIALSHVDLHVAEGEFVTLLGASGSGKSTLLKIIAGMTTCSTGSIYIDGKDQTSAPARDRDLGMVFQNYSLMPHMTVFENVAFPLRVRKRSNAEIKAAVSEALETVRLAEFADRKPASLSGGQQQRVAIARAIVYRPSLVLMDEPLGALDKNLREKLQEQIKQLHKNLGITILYVTHDQQEAMSMSDRVVLMNAGAIEQIGTPKELYFKPASAFAAEFLGESNFIEAEVSKTSGNVLTLSNGVQISAPKDATLTPGKSLRVMIRPEQFEIGREAGPENSNRLPAIVRDRTFLGSMTRYSVDYGGPQNITVLATNSKQSGELEIGETIDLSWQSDNMVVFPPG